MLFLFFTTILASREARALDAAPAAGAACPVAFAKLESDPKAAPAPVQTAADLRNKLTQIDPRLGDAFLNLQTLPPELISGQKIPTWKDLSNLENVLKEIRSAKSDLGASGHWADAEKLAPDLLAMAKQDASFQNVAKAGTGIKEAVQSGYKPTEYELKRLYQHDLWLIDRELPKGIKIPLSRIPFDQRRLTLVAQARDYIAADEKAYEPLYASTGVANKAAFDEALQKESADAKAVYDMMDQEKVEFVMRRPENARWWTPKVGFQNQRVTGTSRGSMAVGWRDNAEAFETFHAKSAYVPLDGDLKPKYGYLRPEPGQFLTEERDSTSQYGEDFYILKKANLRDRTTFTAGDSLGRGYYAADGAKPRNLQEAFIPWKDRDLLVPDILPEGPDHRLVVHQPSFPATSPLKSFPSTNNTRYPEAQYWGPVTLDDVESFEFSHTPPSGEFLEELLKRGIKIKDATSGVPKDWTPPVAPAAVPK
jgi:hypothetical protein